MQTAFSIVFGKKKEIGNAAYAFFWRGQQESMKKYHRRLSKTPHELTFFVILDAWKRINGMGKRQIVTSFVGFADWCLYNLKKTCGLGAFRSNGNLLM